MRNDAEIPDVLHKVLLKSCRQECISVQKYFKIFNENKVASGKIERRKTIEIEKEELAFPLLKT
jgi:hypothetical protein